MKTIIIMAIALCLSLISVTGFSQQKMTEKQAIKESHIDFTKQYLFFTIHGLIEIDGHIFKNDTCKCPIIFQATIDGITIIDTCTKIKYVHRTCHIKGCPIIHLEEEKPFVEPTQPNWRYTPYFTPSMENLNFKVLNGDTL